MSKLSDEKILELAHRRATKYTHRTTPGEAAYGFTAQHLIDFVRHDIEAAVRAELAGQEPVAEVHPEHIRDNGKPWCREVLLYSGNNPGDYLNGVNTRVKLYAAPVVQPEIEAKYNELLYAVANRYPCETRHETALRYLRAHEKSDGAAMAAEKEQARPANK